MTESSGTRPAFYALSRGGWRDYVTLLHPPYTVWHLSYVAIGAALAPEWRPGRLAATLAAFFLAVGIGAHALDELNGRPLGTGIPRRALAAMAVVSIGAACGIGVAGAVAFAPWLIAFVAVGAFIVCAYNLELFGGRLHTDASFALAWGAFPLLTAYFAAAERLEAEAIVAGGFAALLSVAQRRLSSQVRMLRRQAASVAGTIELKDGRREPITRESLIAAPETALRALTAATVALAVTLVLLRLS
jgi:hypothetical protein